MGRIDFYLVYMSYWNDNICDCLSLGKKEMSEEELWQGYILFITELANKYGGRWKDEVLQEGLLGAWEGVNTFNPTKGTLDKWVKIKAENKIRKFIRKEKKEVMNERRIVEYHQWIT